MNYDYRFDMIPKSEWNLPIVVARTLTLLFFKHVSPDLACKSSQTEKHRYVQLASTVTVSSQTNL